MHNFSAKTGVCWWDWCHVAPNWWSPISLGYYVSSCENFNTSLGSIYLGVCILWI